MLDSSAPDPGQFATIVQRADAGDSDARDALFAALYAELHRLAEGHIRRRPDHDGRTTLLHEAYLSLAAGRSTEFADRLRFLKYASRAMRGLIIDYVRARKARKRGGDITFTRLDETSVESPAGETGLEAHRSERLGQGAPPAARRPRRA